MTSRVLLTAIALAAPYSLAMAQSPASDADKTLKLPTIETTSPKAKAAAYKNKKSAAKSAPVTVPAPVSNADPAPALEAVSAPVGAGFSSKLTLSETALISLAGTTFTDAVMNSPGVAGSTFAPGANRPILRGLDNERVRVEENGLGTGDVSAISEDHAVPIDPCTTGELSIIRGPEALRTGSTAVGGVVSVDNHRIPTAMPRNGVSGEVRGSYSSADQGREGCMNANAGSGGFVVHADAFKRKSDDYETPKGKQANSFVDSDGFAAGLSYVTNAGFAGISFNRFESLYAVPGLEAAEEKSRIDMGQSKWAARSEWKVNLLGIEAIRSWVGYSDYAHNEVVFDGALGRDSIGSRFTNKEFEGRFEVQHMPLLTSVGRLTGVAGVQYTNRDLVGLSFEGDNLLDPNETDKIAGYVFEDLQISKSLHLLGAVRAEQSKLAGSTLADITDPASAIVPTKRTFDTVSASAGLTYEVWSGLLLRGTSLYSERAPEASELYSKGAHEATGTFEIGNPNLRIEKAVTFEVGLEKKAGALRFDSSLYRTAYDGFIYHSLTGETCAADLTSCSPGGGGGDLNQAIFGQRDATFYGAEVKGEIDIARVFMGIWGVSGQYDFVVAEFGDDSNVPRMPPHRLGGGLFYRDDAFRASVFLLHAFAHDNIAAEETTTPGYSLLNAELAYTTKISSADGNREAFTIGVRGENLLNEDIRNSTSFKKDEVLEPGASVKVFGSLKLN